MYNPYDPTKNKSATMRADGVLDFTANDPTKGVVESGQNTQEYFDARRAGEVENGGASSMNGAGMGAAKSAAAGGSADDVASSALIASGNPYAIGAGLALSAFNANQKAEQAQKQREYEAKLQTQTNMINSAREGVAAYDRMRNLV